MCAGSPAGARRTRIARRGATAGRGCSSAPALPSGRDQHPTPAGEPRAWGPQRFRGATGLRQVLGDLLFPAQECPSCGARFRGEEAKPQPKPRPARPGIGPVAGRAGLGRAVGPQTPFAGRQREWQRPRGWVPGPRESRQRESHPAAEPRAGRGRAGQCRAVPADGAGGVRALAVRARVAQNVSLTNYCPP